MSSPSDPSADRPSTLQLVVRLALPDGRGAAAGLLAERLGVEQLLVFIRDVELGVLLPAPGFPQTLPRGPAWRSFVDGCAAEGRRSGPLPRLGSGEELPALGCAAEDGAVLVLLGGSPLPDEVNTVCLLLPLLAAAYRGEQAGLATRGHAEVARQAAEQARSLAESLDAARRGLQDALRDAQEADRRKDEFLAMLAHELRNPLAPIAGALEMIGHQGAADPVIRRNHTVAVRQLEQLQRLVDDLLDVSRITRGKIELRPAPVDVREVVHRAVEMARPLLEERRHAFELNLPADPLTVHGDVVRLVQIVANLLNNAAKYTEPGGRVVLTTRAAGSQAVISVRDTGLGIPPELLPRVFDLFTQGHATIDRAQGGLGIGLTLVRKLVEMQGGTVEADSAGRGQGSTFTVRLPLALSSASAPGREPAGPAPAPIAPAVSRSVLVVDDNVDAAETLAEVLEVWGHQVRTVHDGLSALESATSSEPQVVLLDIGLPGLDGYEVARRLREEPGGNRLTIIALSGYGMEEDRRRAREAGFDAHLTKPVDLDQLRHLLDHADKAV